MKRRPLKTGLLAVLSLAVAWAAPGSVYAYSWSMSLTPNGSPLVVHRGDNVDIFAHIENDGAYPTSINGISAITGFTGCGDGAAACTGFEGVNVGWTTGDPNIGFDASTNANWLNAILAGNGAETTVDVGTLQIGAGAPLGLTFDLSVDILPDPENLDCNLAATNCNNAPFSSILFPSGDISLSIPILVAARPVGVPEPATATVLGVALLAGFVAARRRA